MYTESTPALFCPLQVFLDMPQPDPPTPVIEYSERPRLALAAPPVSRRALVAGAVSFVVFLPLYLLARPASIPPGFAAPVPNATVEITQTGEVRPWVTGESNDRFVTVTASRGFSYDQWGRFEFTLTLHSSDPFSSGANGGLTDEEHQAAQALGAQLIAQDPSIPEAYAQALRAPDLTYRVVRHRVWVWWVACAGLTLVWLAALWPWLRFLSLLKLLRSRRRLRRERCPQCAYDLTGSQPPHTACNECGCVWNPDELEQRVVV